MNEKLWQKIAALGGIAFVVMQLAAQSLIQVGGPEPAFSAGSSEIVRFFASRNPRLFGLGDYLSILSFIPFVWFLGSLWMTLRRAEGDPAWLSTVALASGLLAMVPLVSGGGWTLAMARINDGLDPEAARMLFDEGNLGFANLWVPLASMLLAAGVLSLRQAALPGWLGWAALVIGVGLALARAVWATTSLAFAPYVLFWVWTIAVSVVLLRRAGS